MAQRSARRGRDNQRNPECFQHATGVMDPARELPYRPAADHRRIRGRTDGSIRLRATTILKFYLAWEGGVHRWIPPFPIYPARDAYASEAVIHRPMPPPRHPTLR